MSDACGGAPGPGAPHHAVNFHAAQCGTMKRERAMADGDRIPKVLVVDDEPNIRELVEVALKFHGCAVAVSASGKDALHQVEAYEPDLMILDVMLPTWTVSRSAARCVLRATTSRSSS